MSLRLLIHDEVIYEGESMLVPRVGDVVRRDDDFMPVEAVTWDFRGDATVVTLLLGDRPYRY
jgi:hypothetical protein